MTKRLPDRQTRLVHYLVGGGAIFGDPGHRPADLVLWGIDRHLLRMEARFSFEKRMEKIAAVLPRTFDLLGAQQEMLIRQFIEANPPIHIGRLENARQFCDFLMVGDRREPPMPPYLPDIAACELAVATARFRAGENTPDERHSSMDGRVRPRSIRRSRAAVLLRTSYDIRPIFESASEAIDPIARDVRLAIVATAAGHPPEIFELAASVFELLALLDGWADASKFDELKDAGEMIDELVKAGLLEVRR
jgi:hypothetical protein